MAQRPPSGDPVRDPREVSEMSEAAAMHSLTVRFPVPAHDAFAVSAANAAALGVPFWREPDPVPGRASDRGRTPPPRS